MRKSKSFGMLQVLLMIVAVFTIIPLVSADTLWKDDSAECPTEYQSQNCDPGEVACGYSASTLYCYEQASLNPPATASATESNADDGSYNGGWLINCYAYDGSAPHCDNSGAYWCDVNSTLQGSPIYRKTNCTANNWGQTVAGLCIDNRYNCYGDTNCESTTSSACSAGGSNNKYDTSTCDDATGGGTCECTTNHFECDGGIDDADGCEFGSGDSCGSSTGYVVQDQCFSTTVANCTATGARANNRDCDNSDSDGNQITCNSGNGCEITLFSDTNNSHSEYQTCTTFACESGWLDCNGTGDGDSAPWDGCEIQEGGTCGNSTGTFAAGQCAGTDGNCTRSSDYLDCDDDDSDSNQLTCNGPNGCEVDPGSACTVGGLAGTVDNACPYNCAVDPVDYGTSGIRANWSGSDPFLWMKQYGSGLIMNLTGSSDGTFTVDTDTNVATDGNFTLGQKIVFALGEIIDNIVDGWVRITGFLNVTKGIEADNITLRDNNICNATVCWTIQELNTTSAGSGDNESWNQSHADTLYADIQWGYNMTIAETDPIFLNENASLWTEAKDKYNATYDAKVGANTNVTFENVNVTGGIILVGNATIKREGVNTETWISATGNLITKFG